VNYKKFTKVQSPKVWSFGLELKQHVSECMGTQLQVRDLTVEEVLGELKN